MEVRKMEPTAQFVYPEDALTILRSAEGYAFTPTVPGGGRVVLIISEEDHDKVDGGQERYTVTDLMTNIEHQIERSACGLGCRCAATIVG